MLLALKSSDIIEKTTGVGVDSCRLDYSPNDDATTRVGFSAAALDEHYRR